MTTTAEKIAVMQAYEDGKTIELHAHGGMWIDWDKPHEPNWNWVVCDYRVKSEPHIAPDLAADNIALQAEVEILQEAKTNWNLRANDLEAEVIRLREVVNQCRLAFSGYVSAQSAIDMIDRAALNHRETGEEMRTCHHCKKQTAKRQLSCTWCGIWGKG